MKAGVFFDIDGTIWDFDRVIPESVFYALEKLKKNGHKAFLCTGRSRSYILDKKLLSLPINGIIAACGAHIEVEGKLIHERFIPHELVMKFIGILKNENLPVIAEGTDFNWLNPDDFKIHPYIESVWHELGNNAKNLSDISPDDKINKFSAVISNYLAFEKIKSLLSKDLSLLIHGKEAFEAIIKGTGKAYGIETLIKHENLTQMETFALGDSINDLDMITYVSHGIAMGNGTDKLKEAAEYVTASVHEDGIEKALLHYGLI